MYCYKHSLTAQRERIIFVIVCFASDSFPFDIFRFCPVWQSCIQLLKQWYAQHSNRLLPITRATYTLAKSKHSIEEKKQVIAIHFSRKSIAVENRAIILYNFDTNDVTLTSLYSIFYLHWPIQAIIILSTWNEFLNENQTTTTTTKILL